MLLCKDCDRAKPPPPKDKLVCPLCVGGDGPKKGKGGGGGGGGGGKRQHGKEPPASY